MRYNQLTYHKASPFYMQDYLPDRAWFNRKPKQFPSQIPTGQDYFTDHGRKHFLNRFNHSEIEQQHILKSPERYPFEHQIALDKDYKRSLDTIDIEGAASGTRVTIGVKNRLRGQEEIARRHNQSLDMKEHKELSYEQKRRQIAIKEYEAIQERKKREIQGRRTIEIQQKPINPETLQPKYQDNYGKRYAHMVQNARVVHSELSQNSSPSYHVPASYLEDSRVKQLQQINEGYVPGKDEFKGKTQTNMINDNRNYNQAKQYAATRKKYDSINHHQNKPLQIAQRDPSNPASQNIKTIDDDYGHEPNIQDLTQTNHTISANNRHKSNPVYYNAYDLQWQRRREQQNRTQFIDQIARNKYNDRKSFRQNNPTNLSLSLAAQSIVGNPV